MTVGAWPPPYSLPALEPPPFVRPRNHILDFVASFVTDPRSCGTSNHEVETTTREQEYSFSVGELFAIIILFGIISLVLSGVGFR